MIEEELKRKANPDNYDSFGALAEGILRSCKPLDARLPMTLPVTIRTG